ncbi:MAG TPA: DUF5683 domain-containing protein [Hanamia sp.]
MLLRSLYFTAFVFLFLLPGTKVFAQQNEDSMLLKSKVDSSGKGNNILASDNAVKKKYNPKVATFRSAVLPGWGQWYNKKYWKIPIVYGALGTAAGVFFYNIKTYKILRQAVIYRLSGDTAQYRLVDPQYQSYSTESLRGYRNVLRQNIDYSVLAFLILWGINVVDATVDAHLKAFDVSSDIGLRIQPGFNYSTNSAGISLVFFLKDKNSKPLLSLP